MLPKPAPTIFEHFKTALEACDNDACAQTPHLQQVLLSQSSGPMTNRPGDVIAGALQQPQQLPQLQQLQQPQQPQQPQAAPLAFAAPGHVPLPNGPQLAAQTLSAPPLSGPPDRGPQSSGPSALVLQPEKRGPNWTHLLLFIAITAVIIGVYLFYRSKTTPGGLKALFSPKSAQDDDESDDTSMEMTADASKTGARACRRSSAGTLFPNLQSDGRRHERPERFEPPERSVSRATGGASGTLPSAPALKRSAPPVKRSAPAATPSTIEGVINRKADLRKIQFEAPEAEEAEGDFFAIGDDDPNFAEL